MNKHQTSCTSKSENLFPGDAGLRIRLTVQSTRSKSTPTTTHLVNPHPLLFRMTRIILYHLSDMNTFDLCLQLISFSSSLSVWLKTITDCCFRSANQSTMAKKKHSLATTSGYENPRPYQNYLFTPLTGLSKSSFSSVFFSNHILSSRCHGTLYSCLSWPSALSSELAHMGFAFRKRI